MNLDPQEAHSYHQSRYHQEGQQEQAQAPTHPSLGLSAEYVTSNTSFTSTRHHFFTLGAQENFSSIERNGSREREGDGDGEEAEEVEGEEEGEDKRGEEMQDQTSTNSFRSGNGDREDLNSRDEDEEEVGSGSTCRTLSNDSDMVKQTRPAPAEISPRRTRSKRLSLVKNLEQQQRTNSNSNPSNNHNDGSIQNYRHSDPSSNSSSTPSSSRSSSTSRSRRTTTLNLDTPPTSADPISNRSRNQPSYRDHSNSSPSGRDDMVLDDSIRGDGSGHGGTEWNERNFNYSSSLDQSPTNTNHSTKYLDGIPSSVSSTPASSANHVPSGADGNSHGSASAPANILSFNNNNNNNTYPTSNHSTPSYHSSSSFTPQSNPKPISNPFPFNSTRQASSSSSNPSPNLNFNSNQLHSQSLPFPSSSSSSNEQQAFLSEQDEQAQKKLNSKFVYKVYKMCCDDSCKSMINWSEDGKSIQIVNLNDASKEILSRHFKHSNFSSFIRQLNMYGFYKVNKTNRNLNNQASGGKFSEGNIWEFSHPRFIRGRPDLLDGIKRRVPPDELNSKVKDSTTEEIGNFENDGESRERRPSVGGFKFSSAVPQSNRTSSSISTGSGLGIGFNRHSSDDSEQNNSTPENKKLQQSRLKSNSGSGSGTPCIYSSNQFSSSLELDNGSGGVGSGVGAFPSRQSLPHYTSGIQNHKQQPQSNSYSNQSYPGLQQAPIPISGNPPNYHSQNPLHHSFHPNQFQNQGSMGGMVGSDSASLLQRAKEQNYHLGQCVFQLRESLIGLIDWIATNDFNDGRLPFEIRIPTEQQIASLLHLQESERSSNDPRSFRDANENSGLTAGIIGNPLSNSPQEINDVSWSNNGNNGTFIKNMNNVGKGDLSLQSNQPQDPSRPEIYVTGPSSNLDYYNGLESDNNRSSNASNWSVPSLTSNSSGSSISGGSVSFPNNNNNNSSRRMSHADTLTGFSNSNGFADSNESVSSGMPMLDANVHHRPFSAPPRKTSFGDLGPSPNETSSPAHPSNRFSSGNGRTDLTINTNHSNNGQSIDVHDGLGLNGFGLGFNPSILSAVTTPLPPSPAIIQTPNSSSFGNNQFLFQNSNHNSNSLDSPLTPQNGQFIHAPGFGGAYFNHPLGSQSQTMSSSALNTNNYNDSDSNDVGSADGISRSNSMDDVRGRLAKVMKTDSNNNHHLNQFPNSINNNNFPSSQSNNIGIGINTGNKNYHHQLNERRSSLLSMEFHSKDSTPSSPGGIKRKSPT